MTTASALHASGASLVVVDDGSGPQFRSLFDELAKMPNVRVMRHAVNLGKGAALKTGMNQVLCEHPECPGVVTADADGQHDPEDIKTVSLALMENPDSLILGIRRFGSNTPCEAGSVMKLQLGYSNCCME